MGPTEGGEWCLTRGYDPEQGAFTQAFGDPALDASVLAMPRVGFLPATDARVQSTVNRLSSELSQDGLVLRYRGEDGLPGQEGTFILCTFWMVDAPVARRPDRRGALAVRAGGGLLQ